MKKILFISLIVILASSCSMYKTYTRPEVKTDSLYGEAVRVTDTASIGKLNWRELFTDPTLQVLIEAGLENNTDLRIAHLRVTQAEATLQSARLAYLPSVSLNPQGTVSSFDNQKAVQTYNLSTSASWEIDVFGKLTNARRGALAVLEQTDAYRQAVQTGLIATLANNYYMLLMLDTQLELSQQTASNWEQNVRTLRAMKNAGMTNEIAIAQAEANKLSVDAAVLNFKKEINELENSLSSLVGNTPQHITRGALDNQQFPEELSAGIPLQLLNNRPDVRNAEMSLARAFYATNEARSAFYPNITLGGSAGWTNSGGGMVANPGALLLQAVGSLTQPLFNRGTNIARLKIAKAQQAEASLLFQQSLLDAGKEVNNALMQWQTANSRMGVNQQRISSLETAVKNTRLLMEYSNISYLEVLTAQVTLLQAQLDITHDQFDKIQGVINLYHALGGGKGESF